MKRLMTALVVAAALTVPSGGLALADNFHATFGTTGQPDPMHNGIQCGSTSTGSNLAPGKTVTSTGTPFNPANTKVYAGNTGNPTTDPNSPAFNPHPVSQYDVACYQQTQHAAR
jgi:hypothetical protein